MCNASMECRSWLRSWQSSDWWDRAVLQDKFHGTAWSGAGLTGTYVAGDVIQIVAGALHGLPGHIEEEEEEGNNRRNTCKAPPLLLCA